MKSSKSSLHLVLGQKKENWYNGSFILFLYRGIRCAVSLMREILSKRKKATILFATETGRSEGFARNLAKLLSYNFDVKVCQYLYLSRPDLNPFYMM